MATRATLASSARRIAPLAWPVFIGQLSVLAFATIDTVLVARASAIDLAALAVGSAAYVTVIPVFRGFNVAVSRRKAVMVLQVVARGLKLPLSTLLVFGLPTPGLPALGVVGCGITTALARWAQALTAFWLLRRDRFHVDFRLFGRGLDSADKHPAREAGLRPAAAGHPAHGLHLPMRAARGS